MTNPLQQAAPVKTLRVVLTLSTGMQLQKEWGEGEILPEGLRGRIQPPDWLRRPKRIEKPSGLTILLGHVKSGHESDAAHWMGLE